MDFKSQGGPSFHSYAVSKSDSSDLVNPCHGVMVGGVGNLAYIPRSGVGSLTVFSLTAGTVYPIGMTRIFSSDTTATSIVALA